MQDEKNYQEKMFIHVSIDTLFDDLFDSHDLDKYRKGFDYYYTSTSLLGELLQFASFFMGCSLPYEGRFDCFYDGNAKDRFLFQTFDLDYCYLNTNYGIDRFIRNNDISDNLKLFYIPLGGGKGIDEQNGIRYYFHSDESGHSPHIHAKYQGDEISIFITTLKIRGSFKNKKKEKEAKEYVCNNKEKLLNDFIKYTNGIDIRERYASYDQL